MRRRRPLALGWLATWVALSSAAAPPPASQPAAALPTRGARTQPVLPPPLPPSAPATPTAPAAIAPATSQPVVPAGPTSPVRSPPPPATAPAMTPPATQPAAPAVTGTPPVPIPEPVSYWVGLQAGRQLRERLNEEGAGFDELMVVKGLIDGLANREPAVNRAEAQAAFDQVLANVLQRRAEKRAADEPDFRRRADDNAKASAALLAENARRVGVRVLPDGVQVQSLHDGNGRPVAGAKGIVVRLSVALADGTPVATAAQPVRLSLSDMLPALVDALRPMRVGDRWQVVLPPEKAYGLAGSPPLVGPNQAIAYDIELLEAQ